MNEETMKNSNKNMSLKIRLRPGALFASLPGLFYIGNLLLMLHVGSFLYYATLYIEGTLGIVFFLFHRRENRTAVLLFNLSYLISLVFNWLIIRNVGPVGMVNSLLFLGITIIMVYRPWSLKDGILVFYITAVLILFSMSISDSKRILTSSSNYISVVMLLACSFYYVALEKSVGKIRLIDLLPAGLCFYISVWAEGRGGIVSCAFLLIMMLVLYMQTVSNGKIKRTVFLVIVILLAAVILYIKNYDLVETFLGLGKFESRGINASDRLFIWGSYIEKVRESVVFFLFGAPLEVIHVVAMFNGNTHNSFLQLHAYCGIVMLGAIIILILKSLKYYIKSKQYIITIMMVTIIVRGMTDKFIFGQYGMPIMLFFILHPFIQKNQKKAGYN